MRRWIVVLACAATACGSKPTDEPGAKRDAGAAPDAAVLDVPGRTLGMPDLASYGWRKRGGHPAFRVARAAEAKEDWAAVVTTCKQALAADPGHLEASWLLAAGLGKLGKLDALLPPLQLAAAGDFGKWGLASLELPSLQAFLATPLGDGWRRRVEADRAAYVTAVTRSVIVTADGDLFAFDAQAPRWYRLTRTFGVVIGALRLGPTKIAYVTRQRSAKDKKTTLAIGLIDLSRGKTSRPIELGTKGPITIARGPDAANKSTGVWIGNGSPRSTSWRLFDDDFHLTALPPKSQRPPGAWLEVKGKRTKLHALPVAGVIADWDDKGFASAIRVGKQGRVVTVPAPGLIDGNTAAWSPDRSQLAFAAKLDDTCAPGATNAAAFVADATTGMVTELERAADGLAIEWVADRKLAIAGDKGVSIIDLDGGAPVPLAGADGLLPPRHRPTCTPPDPDDLPPEDPEAAATAAKLEPATE
ncbi:MAG: hypothetical protein ABI867_23650 [Kofleriaceae bacterium]